MMDSALTDQHALLEDGLRRAISALTVSPLSDLAAYALAGGQRLRGMLCFAAAGPSPRARDRVLPFAVSVELVHAASLLLDDLPSMDDAIARRGRPCLHVKYGVASAELASMALVAGAFRTLGVAPPPSPPREDGVERLAKVIAEMCWGQLVSASPGIDASAEKTAGLFAFAAWAGTLSGTDDADVADRAGAVGRFLGLAYQAFDDCVDARSERDAIKPAAALPIHLSHAREELQRLPPGVRCHLAPWVRRFEQRLTSGGQRREQTFAPAG